MDIFFDTTEAEYISEGASITTQEIMELSRESLATSKQAIDKMTEALNAGRLTTSEWRDKVQDELKEEYIRQYLLGAGGYGQMTPIDWGRIGGTLGNQYDYLDGFEDAIDEGRLTADQISTRIHLYAEKSLSMFEAGNEMAHAAGEYDEEAWLLDPDVENHCQDCLDNAEIGWVPIGTFPTPGDGNTICMNNCGCHKEYRRFEEEEIEPLLEEERGGEGSGRYPKGSGEKELRADWNTYKTDLIKSKGFTTVLNQIGVGKYDQYAINDTCKAVEDVNKAADNMNSTEIKDLLHDPEFRSLGAEVILISRLSEDEKKELGESAIKILSKYDNPEFLQNAQEMGYNPNPNYVDGFVQKMDTYISAIGMTSNNETRDALITQVKSLPDGNFWYLRTQADKEDYARMRLFDTPENPRASLVSSWLNDSSTPLSQLMRAGVDKITNPDEPSQIYWSLAYAGTKINEVPTWITDTMKDIYKDTQEYYQSHKPPSTIWRGTHTKIQIPSPLASWSKQESTVGKFGSNIMEMEVKPEQIFMSYEAQKDIWEEAYVYGKKEFVMLGDDYGL